MADFGALSELKNQQRPGRRMDKVYGKKKGAAQSRAMYFDLFAGDENSLTSKMQQLTVSPNIDTLVQPTVDSAPSVQIQPEERQLRLRDRRRKAKLFKRMEVSCFTPPLLTWITYP